jgi:hypothetical protein
MFPPWFGRAPDRPLEEKWGLAMDSQFRLPVPAARLAGRGQRPLPSLLGFWFLADGISRREYALVDRAGLSNQTSPLELGLRDKSENFTHVHSKADVLLQR